MNAEYIPEWRRKPMSEFGKAFFACFKNADQIKQIEALSDLSNNQEKVGITWL